MLRICIRVCQSKSYTFLLEIYTTKRYIFLCHTRVTSYINWNVTFWINYDNDDELNSIYSCIMARECWQIYKPISLWIWDLTKGWMTFVNFDGSKANIPFREHDKQKDIRFFTSNYTAHTLFCYCYNFWISITTQ